MKMKVPRLSGPTLTMARMAAENPASSGLVRQLLKRTLAIGELTALPADMRADLPYDYRPIQSRQEPRQLGGELPLPSPSAWPRRASDYVAAFSSRQTTPRAVAKRALSELAHLAELRPTMNVLATSLPERTLADAEASTRRYAEGHPLGPLDGVPFLVKDQHDVAGLPTSLGAPGSKPPAGGDATLVARLSLAGAVFLGKTVLTEWGLSPLGANVRFAMPHNPFDSTRAAGGSSTGSAVGVALGLCPIATAGDGGGSIRIPASVNGIFGIKPTWGRVSRAGDGFHASVAASGPLASCAADLALFLDATASDPDPLDPLTLSAPRAPTGGFMAGVRADVRGLSIGIDEDEWRDASPDIGAAGQAALAALERRGVLLRTLKIPLASYATKIGYLSIGSEALAYQRMEWENNRDTLSADLRLSLAALSGITALEYLDAQRLRQTLRLQVADALRTVDVLALPCTAAGPARYTERDAGAPFIDPVALDGMCRFAFLANLTGLPAAAAPVGIDASGVPVGMQLVGDAWAETTLLALLAELEREGVACVRRPPQAVDLLG